MYDERIEALISAALADGELSEKEKQILFKNAEKQGIDLDEFEMILDARLVELKKKEAQQNKEQEIALAQAKAAAASQPAAPKSDKYGDVRKCPACGAIVSSFKAVCPDCGHEFSGIEANSSVERLSKLLNEAEDKRLNDRDKEGGVFGSFGSSLGFGSFAEMTGNGSNVKRKEQIIEAFPIPNTKEDLLEFISFIAPKAKKLGMFSMSVTPEEKTLNRIWRKKLEEVFVKASISLGSDKQVQDIINKYSKELKIKY